MVLPNSSHAEADLKPLYDTQLVQLENLITSQRRAQDTMREQLQIMEIKYLKVRNNLHKVIWNRFVKNLRMNGTNMSAMLRKVMTYS